MSLFGDIRIACSYYHCGPCGTSQQPWDAALRLGARRVTAGAEEAITLAGLLTSFGRAAKTTLVKLTGIRVSESTVHCVTDAAAAAAQTSDWCHRLKHEGGAALLADGEQLDARHWAPWRREALRQQLQYFRNHQHRMDYPRYLALGWQIGSGPVESACKRLVTQRLKGAGMRWGERGTDTMCHLRALLLCQPDQWNDYWTARRPNRPPTKPMPAPGKLQLSPPTIPPPGRAADAVRSA